MNIEEFQVFCSDGSHVACLTCGRIYGTFFSKIQVCSECDRKLLDWEEIKKALNSELSIEVIVRHVRMMNSLGFTFGYNRIL